MMMKKYTSSLVLITICSTVISVVAAEKPNSSTPQANSQQTSKNKNKFDFYLLSTQWIPGWCVVGTGASGAVLDTINACQKQNNSPLMYHGLWPENIDGSYPANCYKVPTIDTKKLSFSNPFKDYLTNSDDFLNHEWEKHGTCSNRYTPGSEVASPQEYYKQLDNYFKQSISIANQIKLSLLPLNTTVADLKQKIHRQNPQIPTASILVMCESDSYQQKYLTGLWFCMDKQVNNFIACPQALVKRSCDGQILTR